MVTRFEAYKLSRLIKRVGIEVEFFRNKRNEYGEQTDESESLGTLECVYHEDNSRILIDRNNALGAWRNVQSPFLTAHMDKIKQLWLLPEDWCILGDHKHTIGGIVDVQQWGIIGTISLEVVDSVGV